MKKIILLLVIFLLMVININITNASTCGGSLVPGTVVSDPDSCASCHVKIINKYKKNIFGFNTDEVIGNYLICADLISWWIYNFWTSDDEFEKKYPTGEKIEEMQEDTAREQVTIKLEYLIYQEKKTKLNEAILLAWGLNVAIIKLVIELLLITMYIIELLFLIFIFLVIIPHVFFSFRDALANSYLRRKNV